MGDLLAELKALRDAINSAHYKEPVRGFVCTPATWQRIRSIGLAEQRERDLRWRPVVDDMLSVALLGTPVRVEEDPKPQAGEVLLEINPR